MMKVPLVIYSKIKKKHEFAAEVTAAVISIIVLVTVLLHFLFTSYC